MNAIWFQSPDGSLNRNAKADEIVELMNRNGEEFWNSRLDSGFGALSYFRRGEEVASLVFTKRDGFGFHFKFTEFPNQLEKRRNFFSVSSDNYEDVAEVNLADDVIFLPRAFFVDAEVGERIVRTFFDTGKRGRRGGWKNTEELDWDMIRGVRVKQ